MPISGGFCLCDIVPWRPMTRNDGFLSPGLTCLDSHYRFLPFSVYVALTYIPEGGLLTGFAR